MRARKRFGQHFLHDPGVLQKIVGALAPRPTDHIVEIGPGRGALTHALLEDREGIGADGATLDLIEIDRDLAPLLREKLGGNPGVVVHEADALDFDFTKLADDRGGRLRIVGNLPYNISTPLLFHLLDSARVIDDMHVMLQREVVERITAAPGSRDYGRLTVMLAPWVRAESLFDVGPGAFQPPPKVWSAVVRLTLRREPAFAVSPRFGAVVAAAFSHRRKTIRNALRDFLTPEQIAACDIDLGVRPETLAPESFNRLARMLDGSMTEALSPPSRS
jgi:16S rRNA (adenine1518-N6/adenine1519-N6)-dimethyltransferase